MNSQYINTDYRTFLIGFRNSSTKLIIQDKESLDKARVVYGLTDSYEIDTDSLRELNSYGRFVRPKNTPTWLYQSFLQDINQAKERRTKILNEM